MATTKTPIAMPSISQGRGVLRLRNNREIQPTSDSTGAWAVISVFTSCIFSCFRRDSSFLSGFFFPVDNKFQMIYTNPPVRAKAAPTIPTSLKPAILDEVMRPKSYKTLCIMLLPRHKFGTEPS